MKRAFYRWLFWTACDFRKQLNRFIAWTRDRAFVKSALASGATESQP